LPPLSLSVSLFPSLLPFPSHLPFSLPLSPSLRHAKKNVTLEHCSRKINEKKKEKTLDKSNKTRYPRTLLTSIGWFFFSHSIFSVVFFLPVPCFFLCRLLALSRTRTRTVCVAAQGLLHILFFCIIFFFHSGARAVCSLCICTCVANELRMWC
jgi:hypothetical protein